MTDASVYHHHIRTWYVYTNVVYDSVYERGKSGFALVPSYYRVATEVCVLCRLCYLVLTPTSHPFWVLPVLSIITYEADVIARREEINVSRMIIIIIMDI